MSRSEEEKSAPTERDREELRPEEPMRKGPGRAEEDEERELPEPGQDPRQEEWESPEPEKDPGPIHDPPEEGEADPERGRT